LTLSVVCSSDAFRGRPLWLIGLLGWPDTADNPLRTGTVTLLSVTLTACALGLWAPALRAAAGRS